MPDLFFTDFTGCGRPSNRKKPTTSCQAKLFFTSLVLMILTELQASQIDFETG